MRVGLRADPSFLTVSPQVILVINPVVGCCVVRVIVMVWVRLRTFILGCHKMTCLASRYSQHFVVAVENKCRGTLVITSKVKL